MYRQRKAITEINKEVLNGGLFLTCIGYEPQRPNVECIEKLSLEKHVETFHEID